MKTTRNNVSAAYHGQGNTNTKGNIHPYGSDDFNLKEAYPTAMFVLQDIDLDSVPNAVQDLLKLEFGNMPLNAP